MGKLPPTTGTARSSYQTAFVKLVTSRSSADARKARHTYTSAGLVEGLIYCYRRLIYFAKISGKHILMPLIDPAFCSSCSKQSAQKFLAAFLPAREKPQAERKSMHCENLVVRYMYIYINNYTLFSYSRSVMYI